MDGVQLSQGYRATTRRQFTFYHSTPVNSSILINDFSSRTDTTIFTSTASELLDWSNKTSGDFQALKSTSHLLPQSTVSCRSDSSLEANYGCCHRSDA